MSQVKMSDSEIVEVKILQEKFQQKVFQLGQLYLQKKQAEEAVKVVNDKEIKCLEEWSNLQKMENELIDKLLNKYGEGSLDLNAGTFVSDKTPQ